MGIDQLANSAVRKLLTITNLSWPSAALTSISHGMKVRVADWLTSQDNSVKNNSCPYRFCFTRITLNLKTLLLWVALTFVVLLFFTGTSPAQCTLSTTSPSVTICSPANGAAAVSPVAVVAGTTDTHAVTAMKVYVDSVNVYTAKAAQLSTSLVMANGQHHISVNAWDSAARSLRVRRPSPSLLPPLRRRSRFPCRQSWRP